MGAGALRCPNFPEIMRWRSPQPARALADAAAMAAIGARRLRRAWGTSEQEQQPTPPRDHLQPCEQRASFGVRQAVMTKHHPRAPRKTGKRSPERLALSLVRHHPKAGKWLAALHGHFYSSTHG